MKNAVLVFGYNNTRVNDVKKIRNKAHDYLNAITVLCKKSPTQEDMDAADDVIDVGLEGHFDNVQIVVAKCKAKQLNIIALLPFSDPGTQLGAALAQHLKLKGPNPAKVKAALDKGSFRQQEVLSIQRSGSLIFLIRFITATCLFAFLGKANIWLSSSSNVILAMGYRFFLILSPLLTQITGKYSVAIALLLAVLGSLFFCINSATTMIVGAILVGIGLSVSGYLIKSEASETPLGAAHNKIALNAGSLLSGIIIMLYYGEKNLFFILAACILFLSFLIAFFKAHKRNKMQLPVPRLFSIRKFTGWLLVGVSIGIKLFGVFSVLPQYLLNTLGDIPNWYGIMVFLNSAIIIVLQIPIINFVEKFKAYNVSFKLTLTAMIIGMLIISFPEIFYVEKFIGAFIWTALLSLVECCASYLDVQGSRAGYLLIKETSVGLGAGLTVLISRYGDPSFSSITTGVLGIVVIMGACLLLYDDLKTSA